MLQISVDKTPIGAISDDIKLSLSTKSNFEVLFLFKSDFNNAKYLRDYLLIILDCIGLDLIWKNRFVLIIDELNNNAIEYGSKIGSENLMRFKFEKKENNILINIEVEDSGDGEKSKSAQEMECLRLERLEKGFLDHKSIRGRGLFMIITKLVDELYFKDSINGGLIVGVNKKLEI